MTETPGHYSNGQPQVSRLDRIENILATVAEQQQANTQAIASVTDNLDKLVVKVDLLTDDITELTDIVMHSINNAERDRESITAGFAHLEAVLMRIDRKLDEPR